MFRASGSTALFDASHNAIVAASDYAKQLAANNFLVNGVVFVITDGDDNASALKATNVRDVLAKSVQSESLESLNSILIGVNLNAVPELVQYLDDFKNTAKFTQYVQIQDASEKSLAKLADFVSRSISSQSQALGTGGPSKSLTF